MRQQIRIIFKRINIFVMISTTQAVKGISSLQEDGTHIILWDLDNCTEEEAILDLYNVQQQYNLGEIFILSDKQKSFRAICFTRVSYKNLLRILLDTVNLDKGYFDYTVKRHKATLRLIEKIDREKQEIFSLAGRKEKIPENFQLVFYETGLDKGTTRILGR